MPPMRHRDQRQLKWATGVTETVSIGVAVAANGRPLRRAMPAHGGRADQLAISDSLQANVIWGAISSATDRTRPAPASGSSGERPVAGC